MKHAIRIPPPLKKGDVIGVIAPAGQIFDKTRFEQGVKILTDMGFEPRFPRQLWPGPGYLADTDPNRAEEFHKVYSDPEVKGVIAARGGYGCLRILEKTDMQVIRQTPKMLLGFSDITLLLNQAVNEAGMISFHGPVLTSLCDCTPSALERLFHAISGNWHTAIAPPKLEILSGSGTVTGKLIGGNLSTLMTTLGTPYDFNWEGSILLLEDIGEPIYRLDRMLTQLDLAGKFKQIRGLILGDFTLSPEQDSLEKIRYREYIWKRILNFTSDLEIPVWGNFPAGHCPENLTLPLGATATMDCRQGSLLFSISV
jgi:muramoyltetrapeptide carboxypeptidase